MTDCTIEKTWGTVVTLEKEAILNGSNTKWISHKNGSVITLETKSTLNVNSFEFEDLISDTYGAIHSDKSAVKCDGCKFLRNKSIYNGAAISLTSSILVLKNTELISNES
jgi:hypothetical protein